MEHETDADEARRAAQHESMKARVVRDVNADIAGRAEHTNLADAKAMDEVAERFRGNAIGEVVDKDREVGRARILARISQIITYVFCVIYSLLAVRLVLELVAANSSSGFVKLIEAVTDPFYALFKGILASPSAGGYALALPIVVAIAAYALLHLGINRLLRLIAHRQTTI
jgi:uncharacterized protein YggT (Ycf19 family)